MSLTHCGAPWPSRLHRQWMTRPKLKEAPDRKAMSKELADEYRAKFASPYMSASRGYITDVIEPADTRATIALALRKLLTKRELRPAKKHGDIPL